MSRVVPYKRQQKKITLHTLTRSEVHETVHLKFKIVVLHEYLNDKHCNLTNKQKIYCVL